MKRVIWQMLDGSIRITIPCSPIGQNESENDYLERVAARCNPGDGAIRVADIPTNEIPSDREFRDAWIWNGQIEHDLVKAGQIHLDRIRVKRDAALERLDVEFIKALELGDEAKITEIKVMKQALRDLPQEILPDIQACKSIDEIKAIQPNIFMSETGLVLLTLK
jgi:hypothetical protein